MLPPAFTSGLDACLGGKFSVDSTLVPWPGDPLPGLRVCGVLSLSKGRGWGRRPRCRRGSFRCFDKLNELGGGEVPELVEGPGRGAKAEVPSGFVSMFRQAQHIAGSTNLGAGRSLSLSKGRGGGEGRGAVGVRFDKLNELGGGKVPELVEGPGRGAKAEVPSGFVSTSSTNLGAARSLSLSRGRDGGRRPRCRRGSFRQAQRTWGRRGP